MVSLKQPFHPANIEVQVVLSRYVLLSRYNTAQIFRLSMAATI